MGRICSSYSASAPLVKPCCHQAATPSHIRRSSSNVEAMIRFYITDCAVAPREGGTPKEGMALAQPQDLQETWPVQQGASGGVDERSGFLTQEGETHDVES